MPLSKLESVAAVGVGSAVLGGATHLFGCSTATVLKASASGAAIGVVAVAGINKYQDQIQKLINAAIRQLQNMARVRVYGSILIGRCVNFLQRLANLVLGIQNISHPQEARQAAPSSDLDSPAVAEQQTNTEVAIYSSPDAEQQAQIVFSLTEELFEEWGASVDRFENRIQSDPRLHSEQPVVETLRDVVETVRFGILSCNKELTNRTDM